ncbi:response regulator [Corynebacterium variabile]|uniref:DNA-binding response regulator n=2 Tax=Corynebacterium variabile TaxID=1727 RepID=A0A110BGL7_9CORY|nr:response regulator transcription factor [Corynebacterium variabile]AEK38166.1 two-component system response regulator [Corynebacterium variabile DSM 44702]AEK38212.1 two-component system response regulator [Corynebacterium variabile DSM 44702]MDN6537123.1 response regulator transcription factor [Corynebacterium variabile]MDN6662273.1 response regulator transcription factor [Corynebacterium variabile]CUU67502.1 Response regulator containing a CheY-like receiver domain and an HTH DNA-binding 
MIRVLLADDHAIVRMGLRAVLDSEEDITIVGEADTADDAVRAVENAGPDIDVVLMDLRFGPGQSGRELETGASATARIRKLPDPPNVLVVTNYDTDVDILGAIEAGAVGYLLKDAPPAELISAVRAAATGATAMSGSVATRLMHREEEPANALTSRELEVLQLVADGRSNREIGATLFLSEATVKSHLVHINTKLGVRSRTSAVAAAREAGML